MASLVTLTILGLSSLCTGQTITERETFFLRDQDILFEVGSALTLECFTIHPVNAELYFNYFWTIDGDVIHGPDANARNLTINEMTKDHAGQYQCFIHQQNNLDIIYITATGITYNVKEKYMVKPKQIFEHKTVTEGEPLEIICPEVDGYPMTYEWGYRNQLTGETLPAALETGYTESGVIVGRKMYFTNVDQKDASVVYVCYIQNAFVHQNIYSVSLTVLPSDQKFEIVEQYTSNDTAVLLGQGVQLYCGYGGNPRPSPQWSKNGKPIGPDAILTIKNQKLEIDEVTVSDAGVYSCVADNGIGDRKYHSMTLSIDSEPYLMPVDPKLQYETVVASGSDAYLFCPVVGLPEPKRVWTHNNKELSIKDDNVQVAEGGYYLYVSRVRPENGGFYACRAENKYGGLLTETLLTVL